MQESNVIANSTIVAEQTDSKAQSAERAFGLSLLFSGIRCILQYVILPFILPIIGVAGAFSVYLSVGINILAIGALLFSVRRFWKIDYKYKKQYLAIAVVAFVILCAFMVLDIQQMLQVSSV